MPTNAKLYFRVNSYRQFKASDIILKLKHLEKAPTHFKAAGCIGQMEGGGRVFFFKLALIKFTKKKFMGPPYRSFEN